MLKEVKEGTRVMGYKFHKAILGKNRVVAFVGKWIDWKFISLSKVSQTQKNTARFLLYP